MKGIKKGLSVRDEVRTGKKGQVMKKLECQAQNMDVTLQEIGGVWF